MKIGFLINNFTIFVLRLNIKHITYIIIMIDKLFHFDIETCGEYKDYKTFLEKDERGALLFKKKFDKMWVDKYDSIDSAYIENAGIVSTYGKIVCISFGFLDNEGLPRIKSFSGDDEREIVDSFNDLIEIISNKNFILTGFRVMHFDIPWIVHKLHKYGIVPSDMILMYGKKPWDLRVVDMSDDWRQKFAWGFSFDEVAYELGIDSPKDIMNGSEVHTEYYSNNIDKIVKYCEGDIITSIEVSKKLYKK